MVTGGSAHGGIGRPQGYRWWWRLLADHAAGRSRRAHDGIPRTGCHRHSRPRRLAPEVGQEALTLDFWTLDFDAVRAHLEWQSSPHFPAWASGQVSARPSVVGPQVRFDITPEMIG